MACPNKLSNAWREPLKLAGLCQVLGFLLAGLILDTGEFAVRWLLFTVPLWALVLWRALRSDRPGRFEKVLVSTGLLVVFGSGSMPRRFVRSGVP